MLSPETVRRRNARRHIAILMMSVAVLVGCGQNTTSGHLDSPNQEDREPVKSEPPVARGSERTNTTNAGRPGPQAVSTEGATGQHVLIQGDQILSDAEVNNYPVTVICDQCGAPCKATGRPFPPGTIPVMTAKTAMMAARYCDNCKIVVCGRCTGVSAETRGLRLSGRPCPKCQKQTILAAVAQLRETKTRVEGE